MEVLLSKVTSQAMNYAIRTGITITSGFAMQQCSRLLKTVDRSQRAELAALQLRLESKIRIISPAIDMIELIAARGNTSLESAITLTKDLRWDIQSLGVRLSKAAGEEELARKTSMGKSNAQNELEIKLIIADIKKLLDRIEDAVPLINLAITTSGASMSTTLPQTVSPSRLLQASTFLTAGDTDYAIGTPRAQQIGPAFTLSMYMLFSGHANRGHDEEGLRQTTWKEVMHKARVKLLRVPLDKLYDYPSLDEDHVFGSSSSPQAFNIPSVGQAHEFAYHLLIVEDLDDDRVHTFDEDELQPAPYEGVNLAGIRELVPIHEISKIFYADTGKILNIGTDGETNNPILLLKRDVNAVPPRRMMDRQTDDSEWGEEDAQEEDDQSELDAQLRRESSVNLANESNTQEIQEDANPHLWRLPPNLDLEWMAFEVYTEESASESDLDDSEPEVPSTPIDTPSGKPKPQPSRSKSLSPNVAAGFERLRLSTPTGSEAGTPSPPNTQLIPSPMKHAHPAPMWEAPTPKPIPAIKTSLSLLEMVIRLTALQQFQQMSHLAIPDELLTFFLSESSTVGAGGDAELRRRARREALERVGFDPYNESPIKRRGEDYIHHATEETAGGYSQSEWDTNNNDGYDKHEANDNDSPNYDYKGYPHGPRSNRSSRSRSSTPTGSHSSWGIPTSPMPSPLGISSADVPLPSREFRLSQQPKSGISSPSPLLRRATAQPTFRAGPPTAPPTSSSPRMGAPKRAQSQASQMGYRAPETPPCTGKKGA